MKSDTASHGKVPCTALLLMSDASTAQALAQGLRTYSTQAIVARDLQHAQRIVSDVVPDFLLAELDAAPGVDAWLSSLQAGAGCSRHAWVLGHRDDIQRLEGRLSLAFSLMCKPVPCSTLLAAFAQALYRDGQGAGSSSAEVLPALRRVPELPDLTLLAPTERRLFITLANASPKLLRRDQIRDAVWAGESVSQRVVDQYVKRLRSRLRQLGIPVQVTTVRGYGYRFDPANRQDANP